MIPATITSTSSLFFAAGYPLALPAVLASTVGQAPDHFFSAAHRRLIHPRVAGLYARGLLAPGDRLKVSVVDGMGSQHAFAVKVGYDASVTTWLTPRSPAPRVGMLVAGKQVKVADAFPGMTDPMADPSGVGFGQGALFAFRLTRDDTMLAPHVAKAAGITLPPPSQRRPLTDVLKDAALGVAHIHNRRSSRRRWFERLVENLPVSGRCDHGPIGVMWNPRWRIGLVAHDAQDQAWIRDALRVWRDSKRAYRQRIRVAGQGEAIGIESSDDVSAMSAMLAALGIQPSYFSTY